MGGESGVSTPRRRLLEKKADDDFLKKVQRKDRSVEKGWLDKELSEEPGKPRVAGRDIKPLPMGDGSPPKTPDAVTAAAWRRLTWVIFAVVLLLVSAVVYSLGLRQGNEQGRQELVREQAALEAAKVRVLPEAERAVLNKALQDLREGQVEGALRRIVSMAESFPDVPSMKYLAALALLQAGRGVEAAGWAEKSVQSGDRVADSLALLSVVDGDPVFSSKKTSLADRKELSRRRLLEAVAVDPGADGPLVDLGGLERFMGRSEESAAAYRAARALLHPVNQHLAIDTTLELMAVEKIPPGELQIAVPDVDEPRKLFREAYVAMILDDFPTAVSLLRRAKAVTRPEDFDYIVNDRGFRRFAYREELKEFFDR
ncbi:MAG: hypothetical protein Fur0032_21910 [Terrimicrobiaceae bacterium]